MMQEQDQNRTPGQNTDTIRPETAETAAENTSAKDGRGSYTQYSSDYFKPYSPETAGEQNGTAASNQSAPYTADRSPNGGTYGHYSQPSGTSQQTGYGNPGYQPGQTYGHPPYGGYNVGGFPPHNGGTPGNGYYGQSPNPPKQEKPKKKKGNTALIVTIIVLAFLLTVVSGAALIGGLSHVSNGTQQNGEEEGSGLTGGVNGDSSEIAKGDTTSNVIYGDNGGFDNQGGLVSDEAIANAASFSSKSVVAITTSSVSYNSFYGNYVTEGAGSGVLWALKADADGNVSGTYIVTNNHVIDGATGITVTLYDGREYEASLVGTDEQTDVAVILIEAIDLDSLLASIGDSDDLLLGQTILAIGNPLGELAGSVSSGIISSLERDIDVEGVTMNLLQIDAAVNPGNSGGGLFNLKGQLVGIVNAKSSGTGIEGLGFAIPINTVKEVAADLMTNGYVTGRPKIGVNGYAVTSENYQNYRSSEVWNYISYYYSANNGQILEGFYIFEDSSVQYSGNGETFQDGDVLAAIGGKKIASPGAITTLLSDYEIGDTVTVTVWRLEQSGSGNRVSYSIKQVDISVVLVELPEA